MYISAFSIGKHPNWKGDRDVFTSQKVELLIVRGGVNPENLNCSQKPILLLLDQLLLGLKYLIQPKGIQIVVGLNQILRKSDDRFIIPCDKFLFYSMMSNLLKNAIESSPGEEKIDLPKLE